MSSEGPRKIPFEEWEFGVGEFGGGAYTSTDQGEREVGVFGFKPSKTGPAWGLGGGISSNGTINVFGFLAGEISTELRLAIREPAIEGIELLGVTMRPGEMQPYHASITASGSVYHVRRVEFGHLKGEEKSEPVHPLDAFSDWVYNTFGDQLRSLIGPFADPTRTDDPLLVTYPSSGPLQSEEEPPPAK